MKPAGRIKHIVVGLALIGMSTTAQVGCSQAGYGPPNYGPSTYGQSYDQPDGDFYDELSPYGQWVQTPEYGMVWMPNAEPGFQPYATNGHWVVTEYGNTWMSDYAWGWAPFHYGRWFMDRYNRWAWVPGYEWGPAWVSWRSGGGYYGWAPLGPGANVSVTVNIPYNYWTFVPQTYITSPRLYSYCVPRPRVVNVYQQTTIINNVYRVNNRAYAYGPRREEIESVTRRSVPVYRIENAGRPGRAIVRDNAVGIYRPDLSRNSRGNGNPYSEGRTDYSRRENNPNPGTYNGGPRNYPTPYGGNSRGEYNGNTPNTRNYPDTYNRGSRGGQSVETPGYGPRGQSSPSYHGRNPRYEPQPSLPAPQPDRTYAPPAQSYPQPGRSESVPQGQWSRGRRGSLGTQAGEAQPNNTQPQQQPAGGYENRGQSQAPAQPGGLPEQRRSRGPR